MGIHVDTGGGLSHLEVVEGSTLQIQEILAGGIDPAQGRLKPVGVGLAALDAVQVEFNRLFLQGLDEAIHSSAFDEPGDFLLELKNAVLIAPPEPDNLRPFRQQDLPQDIDLLKPVFPVHAGRRHRRCGAARAIGRGLNACGFCRGRQAPVRPAEQVRTIKIYPDTARKSENQNKGTNDVNLAPVF